MLVHLDITKTYYNCLVNVIICKQITTSYYPTMII